MYNTRNKTLLARMLLILITILIIMFSHWICSYPKWNEMRILKDDIEKYIDANPENALVEEVIGVSVEQQTGKNSFCVVVNLWHEPTKEFIREFKKEISDSIWIKFKMANIPEGYLL